MTKLRTLIDSAPQDSHKLRVEYCAELLRVQPSTVYQWLSDTGVNITDNNLELLEFKLNKSGS